ncbi:hypothetical protein PIB30_113013, partial [Stylosanthes scabra]|nr:hypothetical protein [Stylosanthes scabra]
MARTSEGLRVPTQLPSGKSQLVADALSRKHASLARLRIKEEELIVSLNAMRLGLKASKEEDGRRKARGVLNFLHSPEKYKDVLGLEGDVLVARDEKGCGGLRLEMFGMPEGEDRTSEAVGKTPTLGDTQVEMGRHHDGHG